ncbi:unnamed protein product [Trifolium pratense]|uniref:Uncharacterized protein n=1 Tax=Trifolium pratense TaxID=57577 RepID=A0ACB0IW60_TRIPR|nr:unnamed protein product [Trifolium pratense]
MLSQEVTMSNIDVVQLLRPFVQTKAWDYIVVWKYGNDPTRFIEWMGCCCCGGNMNIKEEMDEEYHLAPICRDTLFHHSVRTKTCEAIANLPYAMSLYSGVHAEVAISQQPRWLIHEDSTGTQVLIPIIGGLVELFTEKLIPKDIYIMEFISAHCFVSINQEAISAQSYTNMNFNEHCYTLNPGLAGENHSSSNPGIEGPSNGSNPSTEHLSFDSNFGCLIPHEYLNQPVKISPVPKVKCRRYNNTSAKCQSSLSFHSGNGEEDKEKIYRGEPKKEVYHAKNLITERNRRKRIKTGLFTLRSLVPNITMMDRAAILGDAIEYIKELQRQEIELQDEVKALEVEDCEKNTLQFRVKRDNEQEEGTKSLPLTAIKQNSSDSTRNTQMKLQVEVNRIGRTDFMIKLCCEHKQGGFSRLMEAIDSFGLNMVNANMTTFDGKVLNILMVEATAQDISATKLREYLIKHLTS